MALLSDARREAQAQFRYDNDAQAKPRLWWAVAAERTCLVIIALLVAHFCYIFLTASQKVRIAEHGWLESAHIATLAIAAAVFFAARSVGTALDRVVATTCAILMATGVIRELDVRTWPGPSWWVFMTEHGLQEVLLVAGGLAALAYLFVNRRYLASLIGRAINPFSWPFHLGVIVTFVGAYLLERKLKFLPQAQLMEEYAEFIGYIMLVIAATRTLELAIKHRATAPADVPASPA